MSEYFSYILMPLQKEAQGKKANHLLPQNNFSVISTNYDDSLAISLQSCSDKILSTLLNEYVESN